MRPAPEIGETVPSPIASFALSLSVLNSQRTPVFPVGARVTCSAVLRLPHRRVLCSANRVNCFESN